MDEIKKMFEHELSDCKRAREALATEVASSRMRINALVKETDEATRKLIAYEKQIKELDIKLQAAESEKIEYKSRLDMI